jgi:hypothetical protein
MAKGYNGETCSNAVRSAIKPGEIVSSSELFDRVHKLGAWSDDTIWQHLIAHVVNLPPARHHYAGFEPFLFLHIDGRYELYDPELHPRVRMEQGSFIFPKRREKDRKQKELLLKFPRRKSGTDREKAS